MAKEISLLECRACLRKMDADVCQNLFQEWCTSWAVPGSLIADFMAKFADIEISKYDRHSKVICPECYTRLADACTFMKSVQRCDTILRKRLNSTPTCSDTEMETSNGPMSLDRNLNGSKGNRDSPSVEVKQEVLSDDEYGSSHMDQDWEPTMDIKIEPEEIVAPVSSNVIMNGTYSTNGSNISYEEEYLDNTMKQEPVSESEQEAPQDLPLECMLCMQVLRTIKGLKMHVMSKHSYRTVKRKPKDGTVSSSVKEFACATCRQMFRTRADLIEHETSHTEHICYICNEKFNTFQLLLRHSTHCRLSPRTQYGGRKTQNLPESPPSNHDPLTEDQNVASTENPIRTESPTAEIKEEPTTQEEIQENTGDEIEAIAEIKVEPTIEPSVTQIEENTDDQLNTNGNIQQLSDFNSIESLNKSQEGTLCSDTTMIESNVACGLINSLDDNSNNQDNTHKTFDILYSKSHESNFAATQENTNLVTSQREVNVTAHKDEVNPNFETSDLRNLGNGTVQELSEFLTEQDKSETYIIPDVDSSSSVDKDLDTIEDFIPNTDELNQNMKVHLAINPLNKDESTVLDNKMDIDQSDKSEVRCKLRLVNISELTEKNVTQ